ncbi:hypothetical protein B0I37DRAFT_442283 [Chaetomium sp. MPI-CAGE-AT-0009]|nr:hypothetical protein B0I37DRAFT_442283 [Chaetomium sp. MPI-CAGE-AT-0009]
MVDLLLLGVFDVLRWQLAARLSGVSATTFFQLGSSTQWVAVFFLTITKLSSVGIGLIRLLLPLFGLYFGSILKYKAEFVYYFQETAERIPVFAGSGVPVDETLLALVPASYIGVFFVSWIPTLLDVPKYAVSMPMDGCGENCTSVFLPGGIETARKQAPYLNLTLLEGGAFRGSDTIQIYNAPGILLRFDALPPTFDFDRAEECHMYGQHINDTLQICIRTVNHSLAVGWAACPTPLYQRASCTTDTAWLSAPLPKKLLMTRYKQYATTAYNGLDFSILHVTPTSPPYPEKLNASTYLTTWSKIFTPPNTNTTSTNPADTTSRTNRAVTDALTYGTTWLLRLYDDTFPDDAHTPLAHLRNFLAIPQQFVVTCLQYANYSVPASRGGPGEAVTGWEGRFALPDDMRTTAVRGRSTTRFLALRWVVWLYIASAGVVVVGVGAVIGAMVVRREGVPGSSGFVEVDLAARFDSRGGAGAGAEGESNGNRDGDGDGLKVMRELGRAREGRMAVSSSFGVARELRRRRIRVVAVSAVDGGQGGTTEHGRFAFREGVQIGRGNEDRNRLDEGERGLMIEER